MEAQSSILLLLLGTFIIDLDASEISGERIVGGYDAPPRPELVSLRNSAFSHGFTGVLLSNRTVLTAAQCCNNSMKFVTVGSNDLNRNFKTYNILRCESHSEYRPDTGGKDIAVVTTSTFIEMGPSVKAMPLPTARSDCPLRPYHLNGWGAKNANSSPFNILQELVTIPLDSNDCKKLVPDIDSNDLCIFKRKGEGACFGDIGAPMHFGFVCGIVSRGIPCATGVPDVVTSVFPYLDWIKQRM